jgi:hypothetical protein
MNYSEYISYHLRGDAGVEERMIASLCRSMNLSEWDSFRLIYYYTMTYHIPSALAMLAGELNIKDLQFRTDRRYVRCNGAYDRLLRELRPELLSSLKAQTDTQGAYNAVRKWFFFGRYAAYLFLEVYYNVFRPKWIDNVEYGWEADENYTKGAVEIVGSSDKTALNTFLEKARHDTADNAFAIETSLCAVAKFTKGTRWDGYYTERMIEEANKSRYRSLIMSLI